MAARRRRSSSDIQLAAAGAALRLMVGGIRQADALRHGVRRRTRVFPADHRQQRGPLLPADDIRSGGRRARERLPPDRDRGRSQPRHDARRDALGGQAGPQAAVGPGHGGMAAALLAAGWAFHSGAGVSIAHPTIVLVAVVAYVASFAISLGPVTWVMMAELFPNEQRAFAVSIVGFGTRWRARSSPWCSRGRPRTGGSPAHFSATRSCRWQHWCSSCSSAPRRAARRWRRSSGRSLAGACGRCASVHCQLWHDVAAAGHRAAHGSDSGTDRVWSARAGGRDKGKPGVRSHYHDNYYGAFVFDRDGNSVEAVCHKPA